MRSTETVCGYPLFRTRRLTVGIAVKPGGVVAVQDLVSATGMTPKTVIKHMEEAGFMVKGDKSNRYAKDKSLKESDAFVFRG